MTQELAAGYACNIQQSAVYLFLFFTEDQGQQSLRIGGQ